MLGYVVVKSELYCHFYNRITLKYSTPFHQRLQCRKSGFRLKVSHCHNWGYEGANEIKTRAFRDDLSNMKQLLHTHLTCKPQ